MLAIVACSHAWTWPPTDKTHPQLNWRQPVPVTPEQEGFVHPVLPPEPPADDPPIDCRVPTDRARDFKPNFLRALIQLFTGIVASSLSDSLNGTSAAAAAQAMRGAGRRAIQMLAGSGAAVAAPAARLLDASLRRLDGSRPRPPPSPRRRRSRSRRTRCCQRRRSLAAVALARRQRGHRDADVRAAEGDGGRALVLRRLRDRRRRCELRRRVRSRRAIRPRNSARNSAQFSCAILRRPRRIIIAGTRGSRAAAASTYRGEKVQSAASAEFTELWGQAGSAAETLEMIAWTWLLLALFEITGIDYSDLFKLVLLIGMYTLNMPRLFAPLHMSFATLFVYGMLLFGSFDTARAAQFAILAHIVVLMFLRFQARRAADPPMHNPPSLPTTTSTDPRLPTCTGPAAAVGDSKAVDDIIGLLPYAFLLLVVPSAWASGLVDAPPSPSSRSSSPRLCPLLASPRAPAPAEV